MHYLNKLVHSKRQSNDFIISELVLTMSSRDSLGILYCEVLRNLLKDPSLELNLNNFILYEGIF